MNPDELKNCLCRRCQEERDGAKTLFGAEALWNIGFAGMVTCEICGNKRCPHATDHRNDCTNSNEVGQKGSVYQ